LQWQWQKRKQLQEKKEKKKPGWVKNETALIKIGVNVKKNHNERGF
jgi:hypothetical protein